MKTVLPPFPESMLNQHIAVLGKTGSGKTSTTKLIVEQLVAAGRRVCVLDPIKSDWWGMISTADGKHAGLPFNILGGPRGHVALHDGAGKAIGELVASGALPLSILDMADFPPGGHARFFVDFASALFKRMRGVVYLVLEEAHLFAPKERSGLGAENMAIHWAKQLATGGRSKGIRLIPATQRVQSLHNAVLGSCETVITHRLTFPADQKPVIGWLKANTSKQIAAQIESEMSSLKTGTAWVCSGEAKIFDRIAFPRITTYDNSATPDHDAADIEIETAQIDNEALQAAIGDAIEEAAANDPKALRARIAELERELQNREAAPAAMDGFFTEDEVAQRIDTVRRSFSTSLAKTEHEVERLSRLLGEIGTLAQRGLANSVLGALSRDYVPELSAHGIHGDEAHDFQEELEPFKQSLREPPPLRAKNLQAAAGKDKVSRKGSPTVRKIIDVIHRSHPVALTFSAAATRAGVSKRSSAYNSYLKELQASEEVTERADGRFTSAPGFHAPAGPGIDPISEFAAKLSPSWASMLNVIAAAEGQPLTREQVADRAGVSPTSSGLSAGLNELMALGLVTEANKLYSLHPDLVGVAHG